MLLLLLFALLHCKEYKKYIIKPIVGGLGKSIMDFNELNISNTNNDNYKLHTQTSSVKVY